MASRTKQPAKRLNQALAPLPDDDDQSPLGERRLLLRRADVGFYMALFPGVAPKEVCARFGLKPRTLERWQKDDVFLAGFERGIKARTSEQDEAARAFFRSHILEYVERLHSIATQDVDKRTALTALVRILESQGTLEQQKQSIVNVAINLQKSLEGAAVPQVFIQGEEVTNHHGKSEREGGREIAPEGRNTLSPSGDGDETQAA